MKTFKSYEVEAAIDELWVKRSIKADWLKYEQVVDMIFHSTLTAEGRNLASMEALDAVTRRGHFDPKNYFTAASKWKNFEETTK